MVLASMVWPPENIGKRTVSEEEHTILVGVCNPTVNKTYQTELILRVEDTIIEQPTVDKLASPIERSVWLSDFTEGSVARRPQSDR